VEGKGRGKRGEKGPGEKCVRGEVEGEGVDIAWLDLLA